MKNMLTAVSIGVAAGALVLGACSSGSDGSSASTATPRTGQVVSIKQVDGVGRVLVDAHGKTLYSASQEHDGMVRCTGACTSFWVPVTTSTTTPKGPAGSGRLGVVTRANGSKQVTVDGAPVYTFTQDGTGQAKGNGFSDAFGRQHFTWHAVAVGKQSSSTPTTSSGSGSSGGGSYGY